MYRLYLWRDASEFQSSTSLFLSSQNVILKSIFLQLWSLNQTMSFIQTRERKYTNRTAQIVGTRCEHALCNLFIKTRWDLLQTHGFNDLLRFYSNNKTIMYILFKSMIINNAIKLIRERKSENWMNFKWNLKIKYSISF